LIPFLVSLSPGHDLLKVAYLDGADGLMEIFLSDMQYDVPLDEALFGFEAPADAEVMEGMRFGIEEP
jgi:outer membrane lipoprotein-sorting protein